MTARAEYSVVVPTVGRASLARTLRPLVDAPRGTAPREIVVVDDRPGRDAAALDLPDHPGLRVLGGGGRGPAAARQAGWHSCRTPWVAFLDDDVAPPADWTERLCADLADLPPDVGGVQGRITVPPPPGREPTDAERSTLALAGARWITADMAYRRSVLEEVGGFDLRFRRAYREDTDLALRVLDAGHRLVVGERVCVHPLREGGGRLRSLRDQRGNADDALMDRLHGKGWRDRVGEPRGRLRWHAATTAVLAGAAGAALAGRALPAGALALWWAARTAAFTLDRVRPGPRTPAEVADMAVTSALIPPAACLHRLRGEVLHRGARRRTALRAVLFDRDGTLVEDVPYNGDPERVRPRTGAARAVALASRAGLAVAVVSNQSGIARGLLSEEEVRAVNDRVDSLLGGFDAWCVCPHGEDDGCGCRKPAPGLVHEAARRLGVLPQECAVVGDIGSDVEAARAAGARGVLVPTAATREEERRTAPETAADPLAAVVRLLGRTA
ncbi:Phosphoglycolate phosphatase [Nocardiopsis dassonvillei]|uniref:HAD-IIIA family hydrolase n=1 Tax=Nocardiopsis dassonvillei TaxID=2014 RepID=UPI003F56536C